MAREYRAMPLLDDRGLAPAPAVRLADRPRAVQGGGEPDGEGTGGHRSPQPLSPENVTPAVHAFAGLGATGWLAQATDTSRVSPAAKSQAWITW